MTLKSYLLLSGGGGLLATYLVTAQPGLSPAPRGAARQPAASRPAAHVDIREEAARLETRVTQDVEYTEPSRNPFRFGRRPAPPPQGPVRETIDEPLPFEEPLPPPPPPVRLSGVATDEGRRTAILVTIQGVMMVREGDTVPPDYRVGRIEEDAVELVAGDGTTRRLKLRP